MTVSVAQLAEQALRRLGVAIVPVADRQMLNDMVPPATIAEAALRQLGVEVVPASERPGLTVTVPAATLATNCLVELGVIASDEVPALSDQALALSRVMEVHDSLVANGLVSWTSDAIPQFASEEYVKMAANLMATSFGRAADPANYALLEGRVRQAVAVQRAPDLALSAVAAVQASLTSQAITWWDDSGIPGALAEEYAKMAASHLASSFGQKADPAVYTMLEQRVRRMALIESSYDQAIDAVMDVHANLVARGLARWTSLDVPDHVSEPYTMLAANRLAPLFEKPVSQSDEVMARQALAQFIALPTSGERTPAEYF